MKFNLILFVSLLQAVCAQTATTTANAGGASASVSGTVTNPDEGGGTVELVFRGIKKDYQTWYSTEYAYVTLTSDSLIEKFTSKIGQVIGSMPYDEATDVIISPVLRDDHELTVTAEDSLYPYDGFFGYDFSSALFAEFPMPTVGPTEDYTNWLRQGGRISFEKVSSIKSFLANPDDPYPWWSSLAKTSYQFCIRAGAPVIETTTVRKTFLRVKSVRDEETDETTTKLLDPPTIHLEFTIPIDSTHSNMVQEDPAPDEVAAATPEDGKSIYVSLLPVDLDIVHPVTGELSDAKEDIDDGGYVSVQRLEDPADATSDVTPKTKLKIHAISGAQSTWKTRIKFSGADRFKVYRDEARTQEVVSEQTEFDATQDTTLFFHGLKKSVSRGGEQVTMQVKVGNDWIDGDSLKCTIVQSEFLIQVKAFIPYGWTEAEEEVPGPNGLSPMAGKVAKGDLHPGLGNRLPTAGFLNEYSTDKELPPGPVAPGTSTAGLFKYAPFRVCQKIILTPYKDLHPSYDVASGRKLWTAPSSDHYEKATSVDPTEITLKKGFKGLAGAPRSGKPPVKKKDFRQGARTGKIAELHIEAGATDGAMGSILGIPLHWVTADIHWDMWVKIDSQANPLLPSVQFGGKHDSYPAYEIIVIQSDGTYKPIHNVSPAAGAYPGPSSLDDDNAINIGRSDTITQ